MASDKAVELDAALGSNTVQHRETQGEESDKFLSYFRPCIIPVHSHSPSHMEGSRNKSSQTTMFRCEGEHVARVTEVRRAAISRFPFISQFLMNAYVRQPAVFLMLSQVVFSRSSLDHKGVFIVDTMSKIFIFSGCNSSVQTRAKALDVVRHLKENRHSGRCEIAAIGICSCFLHKSGWKGDNSCSFYLSMIAEDGKLVGDSDAGEFWNLFGGYAPIPRDLPEAVSMNMPLEKLFW